MKYNNRFFPHPVLGIEDDILGEFSGGLTYKSDREHITLTPTFRLIEQSIQDLVDAGKAYFLIQVYCSSTMFRQIFKSKSSLPEPIKIPSFKLKGEVEIHFFICAISDIDRFFSINFNSEYQGTKFSIQKSDLLAYGGKAKFIANKSREELKSVSALIRIKNSQKKNHPMWNEYDGEKIEIMLCEEDYNSYQIVQKNKVFHNLLHSSIVLPALLDALYFLDSPEAKVSDKRRWYKELMRIKSESKVHDCFQIAQNILDQPNERNFNTLITLMEETNIEI